MQNQASIHPQSTPSSDSHHNDQGNQFYPQPENEPQVTFKDVQRRHGVAARLFVGKYVSLWLVGVDRKLTCS